ncbi:MAG: NAD-dependent deacylase, partial [Halomonas sp.]
VVGTSLAVMPAASLLQHAPLAAPCVLVDPEAESLAPPGVSRLSQAAGKGVPALARHWRREGRLWVPETLLE